MGRDGHCDHELALGPIRRYAVRVQGPSRKPVLMPAVRGLAVGRYINIPELSEELPADPVRKLTAEVGTAVLLQITSLGQVESQFGIVPSDQKLMAQLMETDNARLARRQACNGPPDSVQAESGV